jgi:hypothetical protein
MSRPRAVVAIALAVAVGSALPLQGRDESARAEVGSATGPLVATDGSGAVLVAQGLRPGDSRVGEVTVVNAGDTSGALTLSQADRVDSPTPAGPLSAVLDLTVVDLTAGRTVFAGKLAAVHDVALGDFAQGDSHRYRFVVGFPGGGPPALDNHFQVASTTVSYVWSAGPVAPAPRPTATPPASAPPSTLGTTVSRPTARLIASARQRGRGGRVHVQLVCQAACRARFTGTARTRGTSTRLRVVTRTLPTAGRSAVRLTLPRRTRRALAAGRSASVGVAVRVSIEGRSVLLRKTVRLGRKPGRGRLRA